MQSEHLFVESVAIGELFVIFNRLHVSKNENIYGTIQQIFWGTQPTTLEYE